jgi:hypothetical protein
MIGFLILSALTSKGAGAQIVKNDLSISADMLLEFFNSVSVQSSKAAELSEARTDRSSCACTSFNNSQLKPHITRLEQIGPIAMQEQYDQAKHFPECGMVFRKPDLLASRQSYCCVSGLSPPAGEA